MGNAATSPTGLVGASRAMNVFENTLDSATPGNVDVSDTWGLNARGGYRFARWFSTELEYEFLDRFGIRSNGANCVVFLCEHTSVVFILCSDAI